MKEKNYYILIKTGNKSCFFKIGVPYTESSDKYGKTFSYEYLKGDVVLFGKKLIFMQHRVYNTLCNSFKKLEETGIDLSYGSYEAFFDYDLPERELVFQAIYKENPKESIDDVYAYMEKSIDALILLREVEVK